MKSACFGLFGSLCPAMSLNVWIEVAEEKHHIIMPQRYVDIQAYFV